MTNPKESEIIYSEDILIVLGQRATLSKLNDWANGLKPME